MQEDNKIRTGKNTLLQKRSLQKGLVIAIFLSMILILSTINAHALGIAPSRKVVDYTTEPMKLTARIINNELKDMKVLLYPEGDYASAITLDQTEFLIKSSESEKEFTYTLTMPPDLDPGTKNLSIVVIEVPMSMNVNDNGAANIISTVSVAHQIWVNVPYPGLFAEGFMFVSSGNVNDTITFTGTVSNKGTEKIEGITGEVVIKGPTNEEIARIPSTSISSLDPVNADKLIANWKADVNPGMYYAEFIVNYAGKQFVLRKEFMVGDFSLEIKDIKVNNFKLGAIAKFDVNLLSRWNEPIQNVFGEMQIIDQKGSVLTTFKTMPVDAESLSTTTITGYWDTQDVVVGDYDVKVVVYYNDKTSEKIFRTVVGIDSITVDDMSTIGKVIESPGQGGSIPLLWIFVIISIVLNIGLLVYFKFLRKKGEG